MSSDHHQDGWLPPLELSSSHDPSQGPSLWTSHAASENPSLTMRLRKPFIRVMVYCTGVLTSERAPCYAGWFIKSLKDAS